MNIDAYFVAGLDFREIGPLPIKDIDGHIDRHPDRYVMTAFAISLFLDRPDDLEGRRFDGPHIAGALAVRTGLGAGLDDRRAQPLTRQFHQPERADPSGLYAGPVALYGVAHLALNLPVVAALLHVDKVDHNEPR